MMNAQKCTDAVAAGCSKVFCLSDAGSCLKLDIRLNYFRKSMRKSEQNSSKHFKDSCLVN